MQNIKKVVTLMLCSLDPVSYNIFQCTLVERMYGNCYRVSQNFENAIIIIVIRLYLRVLGTSLKKKINPLITSFLYALFPVKFSFDIQDFLFPLIWHYNM